MLFTDTALQVSPRPVDQSTALLIYWLVIKHSLSVRSEVPPCFEVVYDYSVSLCSLLSSPTQDTGLSLQTTEVP